MAFDFLSRGAVTPDRLRQTAMALAVGRTAMGVTALAAPSLVWRPWVGDARSVPARVLGRALGGRDLALGLGTLAALRAVPPASAAAGTSVGTAAKAAGVWVGFAAVADSLDLVTTAAAWDELPAVGRWLIATTAGGGRRTAAPARRGAACPARWAGGGYGLSAVDGRGRRARGRGRGGKRLLMPVFR